MSNTASRSEKALVIGYGNEWRGDDGVGPAITRRIDSLRLAGVRALAVHQLTPELAEELSRVECAIFVDACRTDRRNTIAVERIGLDDSGMPMSHVLTPQMLLTLSQVLYDRVPRAWLVTVVGVHFDPCDELSSVARKRTARAVHCIKRLLHEILPHGRPHIMNESLPMRPH